MITIENNVWSKVETDEPAECARFEASDDTEVSASYRSAEDSSVVEENVFRGLGLCEVSDEVSRTVNARGSEVYDRDGHSGHVDSFGVLDK